MHQSVSLDLQKWFVSYFSKFNFLSSFFQNPGLWEGWGSLAGSQQGLHLCRAFELSCDVAGWRAYFFHWGCLWVDRGNTYLSTYGKEAFPEEKAFTYPGKPPSPGSRRASGCALTSPLALAVSTAAAACLGQGEGFHCRMTGLGSSKHACLINASRAVQPDSTVSAHSVQRIITCREESHSCQIQQLPFHIASTILYFKNLICRSGYLLCSIFIPRAFEHSIINAFACKVGI